MESKPGVRDRLRQQYEREAIEAEVEDMWASVSVFGSYEAVPHPNIGLQIMARMLPKTTAMFRARAFSPVYLVPGPDHPEGMGIGLFTEGQILIPLARRVALVFGEFGGEDMQQYGTSAIARVFNLALADNARQAIFHHSDDDPLAGIEVPQPERRVTGGYEQIKSMVFPEGVAALMRVPGSGR